MEAADPKRWRILAAVLLAGLMAPLDASIINVNLPTIAGFFDAPMTLAGWVPMAYLLVLSSLLLGYGRLGDMWGYRRLFLSGIVLFVIASALCGLSPSMWFLIGARAVQAVGASMFMAVVPAIITTTFPADERGRALGLNGMAVAFGLALGPSLGGAITGWWGWRWVFYINVPIGVAGVLWCHRLLPPDPPRSREHFDGLGAVLAFGALFGFLFWVNRLPTWGLTSGTAMAVGLSTLVLAILFIFQERRVPQPMLQLDLFKNRLFTLANLAALLNFMSQYTLVFLTPFYLRDYLALEPGQVGLVMTAFPAAVLFTAPWAGALSDRIGTRGLSALGAGLCAVAMGWLALRTGSGGLEAGVSASASGSTSALGPGATAQTTAALAGSSAEALWPIAVGLAVFGLGTGIFQSPNSSAVMGTAPRERAGIASGVLTVIRNVGMVLGVAVAGAIFASRQAHHGAFVPALRDAYLAGAAFTALGALLSIPGARLPRPAGRPSAPPS
ncbi:MAG: MFS transporter [Actinomycetia bacterium]|nr:MFS transporter [Actinomycetes bacterium]